MPKVSEGEKTAAEDVKLKTERFNFRGQFLTVDGARELIAEGFILNLDSLKGLEPEVAEILAPYHREISLKGLTEISPLVAEIFSSHQGPLHLDGLSSLSSEVARALAKHDGDLSMIGLANIEPRVAGFLCDPRVAHPGNTLYLDGLNSLGTSLAQALARYPGDLSLNRLTELKVNAAKAFASHQGGQLSLSGLLSTTPEAASELANYKGFTLILGFKKIETLTAQALAKYKGVLRMERMTEISPEVAKALGEHEGALYLDALIKLDASAAKHLFKHKGPLHLNGIRQIDLATAEALVHESTFTVYLEGLKHLSPSVGRCLLDKVFRKQIIVNEEIMDLLKDKTFLHTFDQLSAVQDEVREWVPLIENYPNFKDLVFQAAEPTKLALKSAGISRPEAFYNLNAGENVEVLDQYIVFLTEQGQLHEFAQIFQQATLKPFSNDPEFRTVYLDESIQAMADHLEGKIREGSMALQKKSALDLEDRKAFLQSKIDDPNIQQKARTRFRKALSELLTPELAQEIFILSERLAQAQDFFKKMDHLSFIRSGEGGFRLGLRNRDEMTLGDECSDCTSASIGGTNFWTVPTWQADPGCNFLIQYDENKNLAHKFHFCWEIKGDGEIILTIDAMELGNKQKTKAGMYKKAADSFKEEELMSKALRFIKKRWAKSMGLTEDRIYATLISNTGTDEFKGRFPVVKLHVAKFGGLEGATQILLHTNPNHEGLPRIYLQSLQPQLGLDGEDIPNEDEDEDVLQEDDLSDSPEACHDLALNYARVEVSIRDYLETKDDKVSISADYSRFKDFLTLARSDSKEAARRMRIFLSLQAKPETKAKLSVEGQRIDVFLATRNTSLDAYLRFILGSSEVQRGKFVKTKLYHLVEKK